MDQIIDAPNPPLNRKKGIGLILFAWVFFTSAIAISRVAGKLSSVPTILFFQNFVSLIIILPWMIKQGAQSFYISKFGVIILRTLAGYMSFAFIFLAIQRTTLVNVVLLSNSAPLFIPIIIWLWRRVKIGWRLWLGIAIGFVGIAFIIKPDEGIANLGALFGLGSAICFSISMIAQRRLVKTERVSSILFYYFLISSILSIPFVIETWKPLNTQVFFMLLSIGILSVFGQLVFLQAFRYEKPSFLSSFNYSSVVYGAFLEWIVWNRFPGWTCLLGIVIVCTGGIITILQGSGTKSIKS